MEAEKHEGNVEYKLKLTELEPKRIEELVTQLRYRCNEGSGECNYIVGVKDNGTIVGITQDEYNETFKNLKMIASKNNYYIQLLSSQVVDKDRKIYEFLIQEITNSYIDIKMVIAGNVDVGKSSTVSTLTTGVADNGRGLSRTKVFNYVHELKTGRTSSISHNILGFDKDGEIINCDDKMNWTDVVKKSSKVISIYDLCGHEKYLQTTILGIASSFPDICFVLISSNSENITKMTKEHIFLSVTMGIPFCILITKVDMCKDRENVFKETVQNVNKLMKAPGIRRLPLHVKNNDDVITAAKNIYSESIVPIFYTSNITGEGLDNVKYFLSILGKKNPKNYNNDPVEYHIDNTFNVYGFGFVLGGQLIKGTVKIGDKLFVGPINNEYQSVIVKSIYSKKTPVKEIGCGSYVCLGIKTKITVRRGNVVISNIEDQVFVKKFQAEITVVRTNSTTIKCGYEPVLHCCSIRETVKVLSINNKKNLCEIEEDNIILRSGDKAIVDFEFKYNNHYMKVGSKIILCEGITKIIGTVTSI
jgi:GTPase